MDIDMQNVYNTIGIDFSGTRYALWKGVTDFLDTLDCYSLVCDIGCGNGKYLSYRNDLQMCACDASSLLASIAKFKHRQSEIILANALNLPYKNEAFDAIISIAVLHHINTHEGRQQFISEILRILKPGGRALITVWATQQDDNKRFKKWQKINENNDYIVPYMQKNKVVLDRFYHLFTETECVQLITDQASIEKIEFQKNNWQITILKNI
jgi:SAM-dependent methyltransferase